MASYLWMDNRITTNNKTELYFTSDSPNDNSFQIWTPSRSHSTVTSHEEWNFHLWNSFPDNNTMILANFSGNLESPCNFHFKNFPFDKNECKVRLKSKLSEEVREILDKDTSAHGDFSNNVVSAFDVHITLFGNTIEVENTSYNNFGFDMEINRKINSYVIQYYLPCASIVLVSSISFIIPLTAIPGRVSLVVTLFLTLTNLIIHQEVSSDISIPDIFTNSLFL